MVVPSLWMTRPYRNHSVVIPPNMVIVRSKAGAFATSEIHWPRCTSNNLLNEKSPMHFDIIITYRTQWLKLFVFVCCRGAIFTRFSMQLYCDLRLRFYSTVHTILEMNLLFWYCLLQFYVFVSQIYRFWIEWFLIHIWIIDHFLSAFFFPESSYHRAMVIELAVFII